MDESVTDIQARWERAAYDTSSKLDPAKSVRIDSRRRMDLREFHIKNGFSPDVVDGWINNGVDES